MLLQSFMPKKKGRNFQQNHINRKLKIDKMVYCTNIKEIYKDIINVLMMTVLYMLVEDWVVSFDNE